MDPVKVATEVVKGVEMADQVVVQIEKADPAAAPFIEKYRVELVVAAAIGAVLALYLGVTL